MTFRRGLAEPFTPREDERCFTSYHWREYIPESQLMYCNQFLLKLQKFDPDIHPSALKYLNASHLALTSHSVSSMSLLLRCQAINLFEYLFISAGLSC